MRVRAVPRPHIYLSLLLAGGFFGALIDAICRDQVSKGNLLNKIQTLRHLETAILYSTRRSAQVFSPQFESSFHTTYNPPMQQYYCYIIQCADGTLYTGITSDLERRLHQHNLGRGSRYTRSRRPLRLVFAEPHPDRSAAMRRERAIKALSRKRKLTLITTNPWH
jgi:putative endonuclease